MPFRSEVDPRGIAYALEHAFILERVAKGAGRFRLAGMRLNDLMGMEVRGMPLTALILPEYRSRIGAALEAVFDEPATVRMTLVAPASLRQPKLEAQLMLLPLRSDLGDVSRVLGCLVAHGEVGRAPRRLEVVTETRRTLVGFADVPPAPPAKQDATETSAGDPSNAASERHPHLRLVKSEP